MLTGRFLSLPFANYCHVVSRFHIPEDIRTTAVGERDGDAGYCAERDRIMSTRRDVRCFSSSLPYYLSVYAFYRFFRCFDDRMTDVAA